MRTLSRGHFLEVFASFKAHLRNLVRSLFLVALRTEYCKPATLLKGEFSKFLEKPFFGTYHARVSFFSTELQKLEVSLTLLKCDSTTDALPAILNFLRTNKGNTYRWVVGQPGFFKRNAIKDIFLIIFQNFHNINFSKVLSKMVKRFF